MPKNTLHFKESGEGPTLLLIHGFPFDGRIWDGQLKALSGQAHVLAPDLPGFGETPPAEAQHTMQAYAEDCVALLDALDILEPVVVGGLSMGGYVALAFARHFGERVAGLVLASTRAGADSEEGKQSRDKAITDVQKNGVAALVEGMHPKLLAPATYAQKPDVAARLKGIMLNASEEGVIAALTAMRERPDSTRLLGELDVPALVVHGEEDAVIPIREAEAMAEALPRAELLRVTGAGHLPNMEQSEVFNQALAGFMAKM